MSISIISHILHLLQYLAKAVVGSSLEDGNVEEDGENHKEGGLDAGLNRFEILGTLKDPSAAKPEWVEDIVTVGQPVNHATWCLYGHVFTTFSSTVEKSRPRTKFNVM